MARQVEVKLLCDPCLARDHTTEGAEYTVTLEGQKPLLLCLCEPHRKEFYDPIADALQIYGQPPAAELLSTNGKKPHSYPSERAERGSGSYHCPIEGCEYGPYLWRGSLRSHVREAHGLSLAEMEGSKDEVFTCSVGDCGRVFDTAQGLALHATRKHRET